MEQYIRDQLSKERHIDTIEDILKHTGNYPQEGNGIAHTEAYPEMQTLATPLSDNKPSCLETKRQS